MNSKNKASRAFPPSAPETRPKIFLSASEMATRRQQREGNRRNPICPQNEGRRKGRSHSGTSHSFDKSLTAENRSKQNPSLSNVQNYSPSKVLFVNLAESLWCWSNDS